MRILAFFGSALILLSGLSFYAEHKRGEGLEDATTSALEKVLRAESHSLESHLDEALLKADRDALNAAARARRKQPQRSYLSDTALAEPDMPKWLVVGARKIRAAGLVDDALLEDGLEAHLRKGDRFSLYLAKGKYYLFVRGTLLNGEAYASAYSPEAFFAPFQAGEGLRVWLAGADGTVLYHPLQRFIGSNAANIRPMAAAIQRLAEGHNTDFTQRYLGLEGRNALGAWSILPGHGLIMASEWPREPGTDTRFGLLFWLGLAFAGGGCALCGAALGTRPERIEEKERVFDLARLDADAMEYLEQAKASAEKAVQFAREQEQVAELARRERARASAEVCHLERKLTQLDAFQDRILPLLTGKQVWAELGKLLYESAPRLTVVVYRYSPSSFSLVPETAFDGAGLEEEALAYLRDTRIFLGNPSYLPTVLQTEAFAKWNRTRERHMPQGRSSFRVIPFHGLGAKGAILALFEEPMNQSGELEEAFAACEGFVQRAGTFCDSLTPLIQSLNAKGNAGAPLAGAPNKAGNRPRPS